MLQNLRKKIVVGVVGGSDFIKQQEQLGANGLPFALSIGLFGLSIDSY